jgi:hypothetical protein
MSPLTERLEKETREHHARLEALPCFQALSARTLPPERLRAVRQVLALLEQELTAAFAASPAPVWAAVTTDVPPPPPFLAGDLVPEAPQDVLPGPVLIGAIAHGERMRSAAHREPASLPGHHYALRLALFPRPGAAPWEAFERGLEGEEAIVRAARESFSLVRGLLDALHPPRELPPTRWLNREAGNHPITPDLDALRAALRASEANWEEFPYYAWRFGERGRQFGWSDSAWLVSFSGQAEEHVWAEISWLGTLLAGRGMPRLMLERHLRALHRELVRVKPAHQERHEVLRRVADRMAEERRRVFDDQTLGTLAADFETRVGGDWSQQPRGMGELLVAAVADESNGIVQAVPSLTQWMYERSRFPASWLHAIEETLRRARSRAST